MPARLWLPPFILRRHAASKRHGRLQGTALFLDIAGFTGLTEQLMRRGKEGAERLSSRLNHLFSPIIEKIWEHGFVAGFAGDALLAIFPNGATDALACACGILNELRQPGNRSDLPLTGKIGLAAGAIEWGITGPTEHLSWYFRGPAINDCQQAEKNAYGQEIVLTGSVLEQVTGKAPRVMSRGRGFYRLAESIGARPANIHSQNIPDNQQCFLAGLAGLSSADFREVAPLFLGLHPDLPHQELHRFITRLTIACERLGGYFSRMDFNAQEGRVLTLFGAPRGFEENLERALHLARQISDTYGRDIRIGLSHGTVYAGPIGSETRGEYTVIGRVVNLAARLCQQADWGQVLFATGKSTPPGIFTWQDAGKFVLKGINMAVPVFQLAGRAAHTPAGRKPGAFLVRKQELEQLLAWCRQAGEKNKPKVIIINGEAGMGKTCLVQALCRKLGHSYRMVLLHTDSIFQDDWRPFRLLLQEMFHCRTADSDSRKTNFFKHFDVFMHLMEQAPGKDPESLQDLGQYRDVLAAFVGIPCPGTAYEQMKPKDRGQLLFHALRTFFHLLCKQQHVIMVIEDVQWLDAASAQFIKELQKQPAVFVLTARPNALSKFRTMLTGRAKHLQLVLKPLGAAEISAMIAAASSPPGHELSVIIQEKSQGNPFYVQQLLLFLLENNMLTHGPRGMQLVRKDIAIPARLREVLTARLDLLSAHMRETVQVASVIGMEFNINLLADVMADLHSQVNQTCGDLYTLAQEGIAQGIWLSLDRVHYQFQQVLLRDAAYDMQLRAHLRRVHLLVARAIGNAFATKGGQAGVIAFHLEHAGKKRDALRQYRHAAANADRQLQFHEQERLQRKIIALAKNAGQGEGRLAQDYESLGRILRGLGRFKDAAKAYHEAIRLHEQCRATPKSIAQSYTALGSIAIDQSHYNAAMVWQHKALKNLIPFSQAPGIVAQALFGLANCFYAQEKYEQALALNHKCLQFFAKTSEPDVHHMAKVTENIGIIHNNQGLYQQGYRYLAKALSLLRRNMQPNHPDIAAAYCNLGINLMYQGRETQALKTLKKALAMSTATLGRHHVHTAKIRNVMGMVQQRLGDLSAALENWQKALAIVRSVHGEQHHLTAFILSNLGKACLEENDLHNAIAYHRQALTIRQTVYGDDSTDAAASMHNLGYIYSLKTEYNKAESLLEQALGIYKNRLGDMHPFVALLFHSLAEIAYRKGHVSQASSLYSKCLAIQQTVYKQANPDVVETLCDLAYQECLQGRFTQAFQHLQEARSMLAGMVQAASGSQVDYQYQYARCCFWAGNTAHCLNTCTSLLPNRLLNGAQTAWLYVMRLFCLYQRPELTRESALEDIRNHYATKPDAENHLLKLAAARELERDAAAGQALLALLGEKKQTAQEHYESAIRQCEQHHFVDVQVWVLAEYCRYLERAGMKKDACRWRAKLQNVSTATGVVPPAGM